MARVVNNNEEEKIPFWDLRKRFDSRQRKKYYQEFVARILPPEESEQFDIDLPLSWRTIPRYLLSALGRKGKPEGVGSAYVQSPYSDLYTKVYGVTPIADLSEYRKMYRTQPDIREAIDKQVNLAVGRGFTISHPKPEVIEYLERLSDNLDLLEDVRIIATDMLVYGSSYIEICWNEKEVSKEEITYQEKKYPLEVVKTTPLANEILDIKNLDPVYMRVRRDSFGAVYGYIQWMSFPPVCLDTSRGVQFRWTPNSAGYEGAYGMSILMPLIRNNDLLKQFEADAATWMHSRAVPPLIVKGGGSPDRPYSTRQMKALMTSLKTRGPATTIFTKSDTEIQELRGAAAGLKVDWWLNYLMRRRIMALGVPAVLLGIPEGTNRATAQVMWQDFITRLQMLQEFVGDGLETYVLLPIIKRNYEKFGYNDPDEVEKPEIVWAPIVEEDANIRAKRVIETKKVGIISTNEARQELGYKKLQEEDADRLEKPKPKPSPFSKPPTKPPTEESPSTKAFNKLTTELRKEIALTKIDLVSGDVLVKDIRKRGREKINSLFTETIGNQKLFNIDEQECNQIREDMTKNFMGMIEELIEKRDSGQLSLI